MVTNPSGNRNFMQPMKRLGGFSFFLFGGRGGGLFWVCSQGVPIRFPICSPSSQRVAYGIPNSTSILSHIVWPWCQLP